MYHLSTQVKFRIERREAKSVMDVDVGGFPAQMSLYARTGGQYGISATHRQDSNDNNRRCQPRTHV